METETGANYRSVRVTLPSDIEEQKAREQKLNYVRIRSGKVKIFSPEEVEEFAGSHPETNVPFTFWLKERMWHQLLQSKGCMIRGEFK